MRRLWLWIHILFFLPLSPIARICYWAAWMVGRNSVEGQLRLEILNLSNEIKELRESLATATEAIDENRKDFDHYCHRIGVEHEAEIHKLNKRIRELTDEVELKEKQVAQLAEILERDRERVKAEIADAVRKTEVLKAGGLVAK